MDDLEVFDPFNMDREEFNPDMCMLRYVEECSLQNMLSRKNHIDSEIRTFSSDLQNLLYDNYQKFINASSVISNIKTNFEKMDDEMEHLSSKMRSVEKTSSEILENLRPSERKISNLLKCQETMKKLELLTDLVPTLKSHVESGAYSIAAKHYLKAESVLKKYKNLPCLQGIVKDCSELIVEVKSALKSKLICEIYGKEDLSETLILLLFLGEMPLSTLKHFLICGSKSLTYLLTSLDETLTKITEECNKEILNYISACCNYVERLSTVIETAKEVFISRNNLNVESSANRLLEHFFTENMEFLSSKLLFHLKGTFRLINDDFLSQVLDKFVRQCHISGILTSRINLYHKGLDIILQVCAARCEFKLQGIKEEFNNHLLKLKDEPSLTTNLHNLLKMLKEWTEQKLRIVLQSVIFYIQPEFRSCREGSFRKVFCKVIVREGIFVEFFRHIIYETWSLVSSDDFRQATKTLLCIVLSKYLSDLKQHVVAEFLRKVDNCLWSTTDGLSLTEAEEISVEFTDCAQRILELYIQVHYENMTSMIKKSMENKNWMNLKEPTKPRAVIKILLNDIQEMKIETEKVFGTSENFRKRGNILEDTIFLKRYSTEGSPEPKSIQERVLLNKIFTEYSNLSDRVEPNTHCIMDCLLKKVLKSFIQCVRLKTFNHFSLQQIQIDICYLQFHIHQLLELSTNIRSLFDEIMSSAYNRTVKPQLMHSQIISAICKNNI